MILDERYLVLNVGKSDCVLYFCFWIWIYVLLYFLYFRLKEVFRASHHQVHTSSVAAAAFCQLAGREGGRQGGAKGVAHEKATRMQHNRNIICTCFREVSKKLGDQPYRGICENFRIFPIIIWYS